MIILTQAQADQVRGATASGHALDPIALADGVTFVLPEAVLTDPAHAVHHSLLSSLPTREIDPSEWAATSEPSK